jgi:HEAT repeat protein
VKEDEKVCHGCKADIEPLDHRSYFEKLIGALNHSERTTRLRAAYILGEIGDRRAIQHLIEVLDQTEDLFLIEGIALSLGKIDGDEVLPVLIKLKKHSSFLVRRAALISLSRFNKKEAFAAIRGALNDPSPSVQELAQQILQKNSRLKIKSPD